MAPYMHQLHRFDDSPNNTAGSVHVPGPIGAIKNQTPSGTAKQQPKWLKPHQPSRKPASGGGTK